MLKTASDSAHRPQPPADLGRLVQSLEINTRLGQATELSRAGRYGDAELIVRAIPDWEATAPALDLMARIAAQQGSLDHAIRYWESAIKLEPSNRGYQHGLAYALKRQKPVPASVRVLIWILKGVGVLLFALLLLLAARQLTQPRPSSEPVSSMPVATLESQIQGLYVTPAAPPTALPTKPPPANPAAELKSILIDVDGLNAVMIGQGLVVYPETEMFDFSWSFTAGSASALTELGTQLEPYANRLQLTVVGFKRQDEVSDFFDLALARSVLAYSRMHETTRLPPGAFLIEPAATFLESPYAAVLEETNHLGKYVIVIIELAE